MNGQTITGLCFILDISSIKRIRGLKLDVSFLVKRRHVRSQHFYSWELFNKFTKFILNKSGSWDQDRRHWDEWYHKNVRMSSIWLFLSLYAWQHLLFVKFVEFLQAQNDRHKSVLVSVSSGRVLTTRSSFRIMSLLYVWP